MRIYSVFYNNFWLNCMVRKNPQIVVEKYRNYTKIKSGVDYEHGTICRLLLKCTYIILIFLDIS